MSASTTTSFRSLRSISSRADFKAPARPSRRSVGAPLLLLVFTAALSSALLLGSPNKSEATNGKSEAISGKRSAGRVVGQVEIQGKEGLRTHNHFITVREVQLNFLLRQAASMASLNPSGPSPQSPNKKALSANSADTAVASLSASDANFAAELVELLRSWVVALETENLSFTEIRSKERELLTARVAKLVHSSSFYQSLEFSEKEIREAVERTLKSTGFLNFKRKGVPAASDAEVQKYYSDNRPKFANAPLTEAKENIRQLLTQQAIDQRLGDWYQVLFRKYKARSNLQDL